MIQLCAMYKKTHFKYKNIGKLKAKGWKKIYQTNINQRKPRACLLISDKGDFRAKSITKDREGPYIVAKLSIHQDRVIINMHKPNNKAAKYGKQKLKELRREIHKSKILLGNFNTRDSTIARTREKVSIIQDLTPSTNRI